MVSACPPTGVPTINPHIEQAYILNEDVEAHQPGTNATADVLGDEYEDEDRKADINNKQRSGSSGDGSNESMDWNKTKAMIAKDKTFMQKTRAKGIVISLEKGAAKENKMKPKKNFSGTRSQTGTTRSHSSSQRSLSFGSEIHVPSQISTRSQSRSHKSLQATKVTPAVKAAGLTSQGSQSVLDPIPPLPPADEEEVDYSSKEEQF